MAFSHILKTNPEDEVAGCFYRKSARYAHEGVPEGWSGVEVMESK